jgi:hypothetical protein
MMMFRSRNEWFGHELQNHRREWVCQYCQHAPLPASAEFSKHVSSLHPDVLARTQIEAILLQSEEPVDTISAFACPLCDEWEESIKTRQEKQEDKIRMLNHREMVEPYGTRKQFRRHLGRHMEQLALFALPTNDAELEDDSSDGDEDGDSEHEGVPLAPKDPLDNQYDRTDLITWPGKGDLLLQYNVSEIPRDVAVRFTAENKLPIQDLEETTLRIANEMYTSVLDHQAESNPGTGIEDPKVNFMEASAARLRGHQCMNESDWRGAVEAYTKAIKISSEPLSYIDRASAFIKMSEFQSAIKDCDKAIQGDVTFTRPYIRKAEAYLAMKEYSKCLETCDQASKLENAHLLANEIEQLRETALAHKI